MLYPIAIEPGDETHAYGVVVPDIPGCFSAGDSLDEAIANAHEAITAHLELLAEENAAIPLAGKVQDHVDNPDFAGWLWAVVDVDITPYLGKAEQVNIILPHLLLHKIDRLVARDPRYKSRSGLLAAGAERLLRDSEPPPDPR